MKECDCEYCPLSWEECGSDVDAGCYWYGDLYDGGKFMCLMPNFIKQFIANIIVRKNEKEIAKQYEGITEWYAEEQRKDRAFRQAIDECIFVNSWGENLILCSEDEGGKRYKVEISDEYGLARMRYEELLKESEETENE